MNCFIETRPPAAIFFAAQCASSSISTNFTVMARFHKNYRFATIFFDIPHPLREIARMDIQESAVPHEKYTAHAFDAELNALMEKAVMSGINPITILGLLEVQKLELFDWKKNNDALVRKAQAAGRVQAAQEIVNGKIGEVIADQKAPGVPSGEFPKGCDENTIYLPRN